MSAHRAQQLRRHRAARISPAVVEELLTAGPWIASQVYLRMPLARAKKLERAVEAERSRQAFEANMKMLEIIGSGG